MEKEKFLKLDIKEQVQFINDKTITGLKVSEVAKDLSIGDNALRRILKKNNYIFNRVNKVYTLYEITESITVEAINDNKSIPQKAEKKSLFSDEEIHAIKQILEGQEEILHLIEITPKDNNKINILNMDRSNRKKATFTMNIELLNELEKYNDKLNISKSDIVNQALKEYLDRNNSGSI